MYSSIHSTAAFYFHRKCAAALLNFMIVHTKMRGLTNVIKLTIDEWTLQNSVKIISHLIKLSLRLYQISPVPICQLVLEYMFLTLILMCTWALIFVRLWLTFDLNLKYAFMLAYMNFSCILLSCFVQNIVLLVVFVVSVHNHVCT